MVRQGVRAHAFMYLALLHTGSACWFCCCVVAARLLLPAPRVTNNSKEIYLAMGLDIEDFENAIEVSNVQVMNPEFGRLERQVQRFYFDELLSGEGPDLAETAYWFHVPPGVCA